MTRREVILVTVASVLVVIAGITWVSYVTGGEQVIHRSQPVGVMGTDCSIQVVAPADDQQFANQALSAAEAELRKVEAHMSVKLESTEISRFNAAPAGQHVPLSDDTMTVLSAARQAAIDTAGAFDVTCRPIIELWKQAAKAGQMPTSQQLAQARSQSSWDHIVLGADGATKTTATACVDLGGIAKGYATDRAAAAMIAQGAQAGVVEAGGDICCFGTRPDGQPWQVGIRDPFDPEATQPLATLAIPSGGVCTSGNYFRFVEIDGHRFSHIIDPRPGPDVGRPADTATSVTVVAPTAMTADIWATALSVLGPEGFRLLPDDGSIQALIVQGGPSDYHVYMTTGFGRLLTGPADRISSHLAAPIPTPSESAPAEQSGRADSATLRSGGD